MLKQTIPKKTKLKTYNKGVCPMKHFRFILLILVSALVVFFISTPMAFAQPTVGYFPVPFDTVCGHAEKVPVLGFTIQVAGEDTLFRHWVESWAQKAFSMGKVYLYRQSNATNSFDLGDTKLWELGVADETFDSNDDILAIQAPWIYRWPAARMDTFYLVVDINKDSVDYNINFDGQGIELMINPDSIWMGNGWVCPESVINAGFHIPTGGALPDSYRVVIDTKGPQFTLDWKFKPGADVCSTNYINIGDTIIIWAPVVTPDDIDGDITLDLSFLGQSSSFALKAPEFNDTIAVLDGGANCIDIKPGFDYIIYGYAYDKTGIWMIKGNKGSAQLVFNKPIDTCKPKIDSLQFFLSYDKNHDGIAAIGDSLTIYAFCLSNDSFEVVSVIANIKNYKPPGSLDTLLTLIDETTNNNRIFRRSFFLDQAVPIMDIEADSSRGRIWVTAWDNACNTNTRDTVLHSKVDLEPPPIDDADYLALLDRDSSFCINIGDSVSLLVHTNAATDVESVLANVLSAGIGLIPNQYLFKDGTHGDADPADAWWTLHWLVLEPPKDSAKDATPVSYPPYLPDEDYSVKFTAYDDAGNTTSVIENFEGGYTIDTYRPHALLKDSIHVEVLPGGRVRLKWQKIEPLVQEYDAYRFFVYVDSTQSGTFDFEHPFGATQDGEYILEPGWNAWTSEVLTTGKIYGFVIRTQDNCYNLEFNKNIIEAIPDSKPPLICIIEPDTDLSFGGCDKDANCLKVKALTSDMDAASARIWYRIKDVGGGVPGPWIEWVSDMDTFAGDTTYPGHMVFIDNLCDTLVTLGTDTYELIVVGTDLVGNETPIDTAYLACSPHFFFHWYDEPVIANIVSINGAYNPQTACGFDVTREALNQAVVTINDTAYNEPVYTVDSWVLRWNGVNYDSTRIIYVENQTMPYTFDFNVGDWPKGTQKVFVKITDSRSECSGKDSVFVCVPDTLAPQASIVYPRMGMRVHRVSSSLNMLEILAMVNANALDPEVVANVHFEYSLDQSDWILIEKVLGTDYRVRSGKKIWVGHWDNSNLNNGDIVYLRAIFYDELHNEYITPVVMVIVDANTPDIVLNIPQMKEINGVLKVAGVIDLIAQLNDTVTVNDIAEVKFYAKRSDKPDLFWYYTLLGTGTELTNNSIWKLENVKLDTTKFIIVDTDTIYLVDPLTGETLYVDQYWLDIRAIAKDIAGNVMWDLNGDQLFDDYTFNQFNPSDKKVFVDNQAPQPVITSVASIGPDGTLETVNPSVWLGGSGKAFVQAGNLIQVKSNALRWPPYDMMEDNAEVLKIEYSIGTGPGTKYIGFRESYPYIVSFDPADFDYTAIGGYGYFRLTATCYDKLSNTPKTDTVGVYILDVTGNQVVIISPANNSYNHGAIPCSSAALNFAWDDIKAVTYQYGVITSSMFKAGAQQETIWYDIARVPTPTPTPTWDTLWQTFNNDLNHNGDFTDDDGWYFMRAISEDSAGNTAIGPMLKVNVTNHNPTVYIREPANKAVVGPNLDIRDELDVTLTAAAYKYSPNSAGLYEANFGWKSITSGSFTWLWAVDTLLYQDSIFTKLWRIPNWVSSGWYHVTARVYDSTYIYSDGNWASDTIEVLIDNNKPNGNIIAINGDHETYRKDITFDTTVVITARAWDLPADYNAGLDTIQFIIQRESDGTPVFFGTPLDYDSVTQEYWITWNHMGMPSGTYFVFLRLVDKVRNVYVGDIPTASMVIRDVTTPVGVVRAFHPYHIFASTENQVDYLQIQYQPYTGSLGGSDWINLGLANIYPNTTYYGPASRDTLWWTPWDPMSLAGSVDKEYLFRAVPLRGEIDKQGVKKLVAVDNFVPPPTVHVTITPTGEVSTEKTPDIGPMSFMANLAYDTKGTISLTQTGPDKPYLLAIFSDLDNEIQYVTPLTLDKMTDEDTYNGFFDARWISAIGGTADFFASIYNGGAFIHKDGFVIHKVFKAFGTNGWVWSHDGTAKINMPPGVIDDSLANLLIFPAQKPDVIDNSQKDIKAVGNGNHMLQQFYLYLPGVCPLGQPCTDGRVLPPSLFTYSTIVLSYNKDSVSGDESQLFVGRWDSDELVWESDGITGRVVDTVNNTVTFKTNKLGLYAVLERATTIRASIEVEPNCSGYTYKFPLFKATIYDENLGVGGVDTNTIEVRYRLLGATYWQYAYQNNDYTADFHHPHHFHDGYDASSGILKLVKIQAFDPGTYEIEVSAWNINGVPAADTTTFTVETTPPRPYIPPHYVTKNPSFWFTVKDDKSGVDTNSIYVDLQVAVDNSEHVFERRPIYPISQVEIVNDTVYIGPLNFEMKDGQYLHVVVYNGNYRLENQENGELVRVYDDNGILDCVGNMAKPLHQWFPIDRSGPVITRWNELSDRPIEFQITDSLSEVDWTTVSVTPCDSFTYDEVTGMVYIYLADGNFDVTVTVADKIGNTTPYKFKTETGELLLTNPHNYPNPFNNSTRIILGNTKAAYLTVKVYDFAGEPVNTLLQNFYKSQTGENSYVDWYGDTDKDEKVANGIYLCHISAKDSDGKTATAVIKIAVVKKD